MAFTDAEKTDIRRYCGYGAYGGAQPFPASGYRFSTQYGVLEYKMQTLNPSEEAVVRTTFLANLGSLETDIFGPTGIRTNLDTSVAAVWTHNPNELRDRRALYDTTRREFCGFLGITPGPALKSGGGLTLIV